MLIPIRSEPPAPIIRHTQTVLGDGFILAIWRQLSTPQRTHLLAARNGRIGEVTLGDIERIRRVL